jgi:predicted amidophosphoribosyltransferase
VLAELVDLVLPRRCVGCGAAAAGLCGQCVDRVVRTEPLAVACAPVLVCAGATYGGPVRAAILRYKERGRRDLARPLSGLLARAVTAVLSGQAPQLMGRELRPVLVGVPSGRSAAAARGGDHVARLARLAGMRTGVPVTPGVLRLVRAKQDSAGLDVRARAANLAGVFAAAPAPAGVAALLVDDIVTTGATVREAVRSLAKAGWPVLGAAAVAATPRRRAADGAGSVDLPQPGQGLAIGVPLARQRHPV